MANPAAKQIKAIAGALAALVTTAGAIQAGNPPDWAATGEALETLYTVGAPVVAAVVGWAVTYFSPKNSE